MHFHPCTVLQLWKTGFNPGADQIIPYPSRPLNFLPLPCLLKLKENTESIAVTLLLFHKEWKTRVGSLEKYFDGRCSNLLLLYLKSLLLPFFGELSGCLELETVSVGVSGLQRNATLGWPARGFIWPVSSKMCHAAQNLSWGRGLEPLWHELLVWWHHCWWLGLIMTFQSTKVLSFCLCWFGEMIWFLLTLIWKRSSEYSLWFLFGYFHWWLLGW